MCLGTSQGENDAEPYFNKIVCGDEDGRSSAIWKTYEDAMWDEIGQLQDDVISGSLTKKMPDILCTV